MFDRAAADAGIPGLTPHELRHTAASLAVSAGTNVNAVQRILGHASAAMTFDVCSGLFDADLDGWPLSETPTLRSGTRLVPQGAEARSSP